MQALKSGSQVFSAVQLTPSQTAVVNAPLDSRLFVHGIAGVGKSTAAARRLQFLLAKGVPGDTILLLAPQRTLHSRYVEALRAPEVPPGTQVVPTTLGGLARRMCDLFWPLVAGTAGFGKPNHPPLFLTLETSQYYMARVVRPLLDQGYFASLSMDRNRLFSQILDSLNKSAVVGFPPSEIGARLRSAWVGETARSRMYEDAQECASRFRRLCLENNLLDFSLQVELFWDHLWRHPRVREYLQRSYRHLLYDNVEEDVPRAHDLVREWMPELTSALLIYDDEAGYRRFLGADPGSGWALRELCGTTLDMGASFVMSRPVQQLAASLQDAIAPAPGTAPTAAAGDGPGGRAVDLLTTRFYPELLDAVVARLNELFVHEEIQPAEVVIIAPFISDALRFALVDRLRVAGIPWRTVRPSRSLRDEPVSRALLTIAAIAHPAWDRHPVPFDVAQAFALTLRTDLIRARLLADIVYRQRTLGLSSFEQIQADQAARLTADLGRRYTRLRTWLLQYTQETPLPLDIFFRRLFGELLAQPGYGLHHDLDGSRAAASLVESIHKFRLSVEAASEETAGIRTDIGLEYASTLEEGLLAAQFIDTSGASSTDAVLISPAYSFLMMNQPATLQVWLDAGSDGWWQRLDQPLTHTHVLSREWPAGRQWTFADEDSINTDSMRRLVLGLLRRCRQGIILGVSNLGEAGFEQRGRLLAAFQGVLRREQLA